MNTDQYDNYSQFDFNKAFDKDFYYLFGYCRAFEKEYKQCRAKKPIRHGNIFHVFFDLHNTQKAGVLDAILNHTD